MSSEPPPNPITSSFNLSAWIQAVGSGLSITLANTLYLSKTVASTAAGLITFSAGIQTNTIVAATGNDVTVGQLAINKTVTLYSPQLGNLIADPTDSTAKVPSTGWVQLWFGNLLTTTGLNWTQAQTFNGGVNTGSLVPLTSSGTLSIAPSSAAISIGTSQANTNTVSIGASGSINSIPGATTCGTILSNNYNTATPASDVNICLSSTGSVKLAVVSNRSGVLNLGDGASSTGAVHLNNGATASGNTRIMNGTNQSGELTLGDTTATNTVVIAVNRPLTLGYAPSAITTSSQLGYTTTDAITLTGAIPNAVVTPIFTAIILPAGVWLITYSLRLRSSGTTTVASYYMWGEDSITVQTPTYAMNAENTAFITDTNGFSNTGTFVVTSTGTTTYNIGIYIAYSGSTILIDFGLPDFGSVVRRTRIA